MTAFGRLPLALVMAGAGVLHFAIPETYARIVPPSLPSPRGIVYASGAAEVACGALLASRRTVRVGGWATAVLLLAVWPANVYMAVEGGLGAVPAWVAWARVPLQLPLIAWAVAVARQPRALPPPA